jgi:hypothetical protein
MIDNYLPPAKLLKTDLLLYSVFIVCRFTLHF